MKIGIWLFSNVNTAQTGVRKSLESVLLSKIFKRTYILVENNKHSLNFKPASVKMNILFWDNTWISTTMTRDSIFIKGSVRSSQHLFTQPVCICLASSQILFETCCRTRKKIWFVLDISKFHYPGQNIGSHWPPQTVMLLCKLLCTCIIPVSKISFIIQVMKGNAQKYANHNPGMASYWTDMESSILHENWKDIIQCEQQSNHAIALMEGVHLSSFHCYI